MGFPSPEHWASGRGLSVENRPRSPPGAGKPSRPLGEEAPAVVPWEPQAAEDQGPSGQARAAAQPVPCAAAGAEPGPAARPSVRQVCYRRVRQQFACASRFARPIQKGRTRVVLRERGKLLSSRSSMPVGLLT